MGSNLILNRHNNISIPYIGMMKFLLILGVVLIHCSPYSMPVRDSFGARVVYFVSSNVCNICVPCFFFLSGSLFFYGLRKFSPSIYVRKIKSRFHTLLVPYLFWCAFCALLLFIKVRCLNFPGLGIFLENGKVDAYNFIMGFWSIKAAGGYPYAFAFWFIRNLMVFCLLSPLVYLLAKSKALTAIFTIACVITGNTFYGFLWFVLGASYVWQYYVTPPEISTNRIIAASALYWCICFVQDFENMIPFFVFIMILKVTAGLYLTLSFAKLLTRHFPSHIVHNITASTFMIYASHQCYCTIVRNVWWKCVGVKSEVAPIMAYLLTFITLATAGYLIYIILRHLNPKILYIITGRR